MCVYMNVYILYILCVCVCVQILTCLLSTEVIQWVSCTVGVHHGDLEVNICECVVDLHVLTGVSVRVHHVPHLRPGLMRHRQVLLRSAQTD